jgi:hypothetical protein
MSDLNNIPTEKLLYELYERVDDNLFAPERKYDPYLDTIDRIEKLNLCQILRITYEDYKDVGTNSSSDDNEG